MARPDADARSLADRLEIAELTARYNFAIDNRDLKSVGELFTDQASFGSKDGAMRAAYFPPTGSTTIARCKPSKRTGNR